MRITIITQPEWHPFDEELDLWIKQHSEHHSIDHCTNLDDLPGGDVLFIIAFHHLVIKEWRDLYNRCYVCHGSALPYGRGWSPVEWQILEGAREITVSLIVAEDELDTGGICCQTTFEVADHELRDEIETKLYTAWSYLMTHAIDEENRLVAVPQVGESSTFRKRTPADSQLDPTMSLSNQFDILRIADPKRFPAFIEIRGHRYHLHITKVPHE